jgi:tetratricopeptide (TPR) repeat protein
MVLKLLGDIARQLGQYTQSASYYQRALEINSRIQHARQSGETLTGLAALQRDLGAYARADEYLAQALAVLPEEETASYLRALSLGCSLHYLGGDLIRAQSLGKQAVAQSADFPVILAEALTNLGQVLVEVGEMTTARQHFVQALEIRQNLGQLHRTAGPSAGLAQIALAQGDLETALVNVETIWLTDLLPQAARPLWVYLTCCQVFLRVGDTRNREVLIAAQDLLQERAANIDGEEQRAAFLEAVPENREIARLLQECP